MKVRALTGARIETCSPDCKTTPSTFAPSRARGLKPFDVKAVNDDGTSRPHGRAD